MKYRGVIFDLDGVICDTDSYHYRSLLTRMSPADLPDDVKQDGIP